MIYCFWLWFPKCQQMEKLKRIKMIHKCPEKKKREVSFYCCVSQVHPPLPLTHEPHFWDTSMGFSPWIVSALFLLDHQYTGLQSLSETPEMINWHEKHCTVANRSKAGSSLRLSWGKLGGFYAIYPTESNFLIQNVSLLWYPCFCYQRGVYFYNLSRSSAQSFQDCHKQLSIAPDLPENLACAVTTLKKTV